MALLTLPAPRTPDPYTAPVVRWGILGTGWIADRFVHALQTHTRQVIQAVGSRTDAGAAAAAARWGVGTAYGSYAALVADPDVDIVYIATPHNHHLPDALLAIGAGKHVLIEKPVAMTAEEGREIWAAAQERGVLCLEAMWTAFLPKYDVLRQVLDGGVEAGIGRILSVRADQGEWFPPTHRIMNSSLAGGPLLDLFTYLATLSTWTVGMPLQVTAVGSPVEPPPPASPGGINGQLSASLVTATGAVSTLYSSIVEDTPTGAVIQGTHGRIEIDGWFYRPGGFTVVIDERQYGGSGERRLRYDEPEIGHEALFWQACEAARLIAAGETRSALRPFEDTIATLEVLDRVRLAVGFDFAEARAEREGAAAAD